MLALRRGRLPNLLRTAGLLPINVTVSSLAPLEELAEVVTRVQPDVITGHALAVQSLAEHQLEQHVRKPPGVAIAQPGQCRERHHERHGAAEIQGDRVQPLAQQITERMPDLARLAPIAGLQQNRAAVGAAMLLVERGDHRAAG